MTLRHLISALALAAVLTPCRAVWAEAGDGAVTQAAVSGSGFTVQTLHDGGAAFSNRHYVWAGVPAALQGWQYTQTEGGQPAVVTATPAQAGFVYAASAASLPGWEPLPKFTFQSGWTGTLLLAPRLEQAAEPAQAVPVPPGVVVDYSPAASRAYVGSPSLVILPNGDYLASHDLFGPGTTSDQTRLFVSHDKGQTWAHQADIGGAFWSALFVNAGQVYLMGTSREFGDVVIRRSGDGGRTWTTPADAASGLLASGGKFHCAPGPVVVHGGRIWRAMEHLTPGVKGRHFLAFVLSAPLNADLLQASGPLAARWTSIQAGPATTGWKETPSKRRKTRWWTFCEPGCRMATGRR
jgi:hypothetical protein